MLVERDVGRWGVEERPSENEWWSQGLDGEPI